MTEDILKGLNGQIMFFALIIFKILKKKIAPKPGAAAIKAPAIPKPANAKHAVHKKILCNASICIHEEGGKYFGDEKNKMRLQNTVWSTPHYAVA